MNVGYEGYNTSDVAQLLGVQQCTVGYWCQHGYIRFQDVSSAGSTRPRYLFEEDEVDRVSKLIDKYGKKNWILHNDICKKAVEPITAETETVEVGDPEDYIPGVEETIGDLKKLRALQVQRDNLLKELDCIEVAIAKMQEKIIDFVKN